MQHMSVVTFCNIMSNTGVILRDIKVSVNFLPLPVQTGEQVSELVKVRNDISTLVTVRITLVQSQSNITEFTVSAKIPIQVIIQLNKLA
jgi:hypothetical protein